VAGPPRPGAARLTVTSDSTGIGRAEMLVDDTVSAAAIGIATDADPPGRARAVVVGGGIIGTAVALHLAELGWTDTVLVERSRLSAGTTWHPAGLLAGVRATHPLTEMASYSNEAYASLAERSGIENGFNRRGCITVARTPERMTELRYTLDMARHHGIEAHEVDPAAIAAVNPLLDVDGLVGGVLTPGDGTVNPGASTLALAKLAHDRGVTIVEGAAVTELELTDGRIGAVHVAGGRIECEATVLCTGLWTWRLARSVGVPAALYAAEHMWVMSSPLATPVESLPYVRDLDGHFYVRGYRDRLITGAFEPDGKPRGPDSIPDDFAFGEFEPDREHFELPLGKARERLPALRELEIDRWLSAPETFTPDAMPLLGEAAEVPGLFFAAGLNSQGILLGPGVGRAVAQWVVDGAPGFDSAAMDVRRFAPQQAGLGYLHERTRETLGLLYAMHWPFLQPETSRGTRRTPLHERTAAAGACFGELCGWERPNFYGEPGSPPRQDYGWGKPTWFDRTAAEHEAVREAVAVFDLSSFGKLLVGGPGALAAVQRTFTADLDVEVGKVTYTAMLNAAGGIEVDLTVTRMSSDEFLIVAPTVTQRSVLGRLRQEVDAEVVDVTSGYATLAVMGPQSRRLLERLTDAGLDNEAFPYQAGRKISIGPYEVIALRVSFVGELGWELYVPSDGAVGAFDLIAAAGADLGLRPAGYYALDTLRIEKGFRHWGADIGPADNPLETGIGFTVDWGKDFVGKGALERVRAEPLQRRMAHLLLADPEPMLYHGEPVLSGGEVVGKVTSGAYANTLGAAAALAMLEIPELDAEKLATTELEVLVAGRPFDVSRASFAPLYDPRGERMRM